MVQDTLKSAVDTVQRVQASGFSWGGLVGAVVTAAVSAVLAYFGGKHGARSAVVSDNYAAKR